jgi:protoporphyrinogen oxidase
VTQRKVSYALIGGGLPSLVCASLLMKADPNLDICIIEKATQFGGQYKSLVYPTGEIFDQGMHIYYETEIPQLDEVIFTTLLPAEWNILAENQKDIAGIFYKGKLQTNTPYPDLRPETPREKSMFFASLVSNLGERLSEPQASAAQVLDFHFGRELSRTVFHPILRKLYRRQAHELDPLALRLTAMNRVVLFAEEPTRDLMKSDYLRQRLGYPDQLSLPVKRESKSRGLYPKTFGFGRVIDGLVSRLENMGVQLLTQKNIQEIRVSDASVTAIRVDKDENSWIDIEKGLIWSADIFSLLRLFKNPAQSKLEFTNKYFVNLIIRIKPKMAGLYYFYNFDEFSDIFRVTNYEAYCGDASREGYFPLCIEYWPSMPLSQEEIVEKVIDDLLKMEVIDCRQDVTFSNIPDVPLNFPNPSCEGIDSIRKANEMLAEMDLKNLVNIGVLSNNGNFFLHEILNNAFYQLVKKGWI